MNLFASYIETPVESLALIPGLVYFPSYLDYAEEKWLWYAVNSQPWLSDLKRRVQHYGYKYDYKARFIDYHMKIGELPPWVMPLAGRIHADGLMPQLPDQLIINEYQPGQGIAAHVDCEPCFGPAIVSVSLGSPCIMDFVHRESKQHVEVLLQPGSLVLLSGAARYEWTHGIKARKSDVFQGHKIPRRTRISLTFRNVMLEKNKTP